MNTILIKILNKLKLLGYLNINGSIRLNDQSFKVPILQKVGLSNLFMTEPWMIKLLNIVLAVDGKGFIDVGVNIGQTLLKLRSVSSDIEYIGFEPNPQCVSYVNKLIKENNIQHTRIIPVGISNQNEIGELRLFSQGETDSQASIVKDFRINHPVSKVEYIPLFELSKIKETIDMDGASVLKIDVEGAELEVIKGFYEGIKKTNPIILMEILPVNAYHNDHDIGIERQNEIQNLLSDAGYSMYRVIKEKEVLKDLEEIQEIGIHTDLNRCEYVMVPDNKKTEFENACKQQLAK